MSEPEHPEPEELPKSVLQELEDRTGTAPKLTLHGSDSVMAGGSPFVDPKSIDRSLLPKGRGNYQMLGEIARGGMGTVLKGHDTDLGRDIAVKVLEAEKANNPAVVQRFVEEAQIGGQLQHPGIVPVYELGLMADDRPYFTMKLVKGRTLSALLSARKALDEDRHRFLSIFESICQTVAYAHSKGVIHRDLKPANVMVGAFGEVQVVDWGLAKVLGRGGVEDEQRALESQMTVIETVRSGPGSTGTDSMAGSVMGTPPYMSPEQANGALDKVDERSDVFSLGAVLCEILTGKPPYVGEDNRETLIQASRAALDDAHERIEGSGADEELKRLCVECMKPARQVRPQNAEEVAGRVHDYLASTEKRAHDAELRATAARVRMRATAVVGLVVVMALVGGGWGYLSVQKAHAQRVEEARIALTEAQDDGRELQNAGRHAEALEVAESAQRIAQTLGVDELSERAGALVADARSQLERAERQRETDRRNRDFVERLDAIRNRYGIVNVEISDSYDAAFREYGLDMNAEDLAPTIDVMLASGIAEEFAIALDDWARWRTWNTQDDPYVAERLSYLAIDLDPHPVRREIREAILARDEDALIDIARSERFDTLGPDGKWFLCIALLDERKDDAMWSALVRALDRHPSDFLLNRLAAELGDDPQLELRYSAVARSLRPDNAHANSAFGWDAQAVGDHATAARAFQKSLELDPDQADVAGSLALSLGLTGNFEGALQALQSKHELAGTDPEYDVSCLFWSSQLREVGCAEVFEAMETDAYFPGEGYFGRSILASIVFENPAATAEDLRRALAVAEKNARIKGAESRWYYDMLSDGYLRLERWEDALAAVDMSDEMDDPAPLSLCHHAARRAIAHVGLGDPEQARLWLERAEGFYEQATHARPDDWRPENLMLRLLDRAREAVGQ